MKLPMRFLFVLASLFACVPAFAQNRDLVQPSRDLRIDPVTRLNEWSNIVSRVIHW